MKKMLVLGRFVKEYEPVRLVEAGEEAGFKVDIVKYGQVSLGVVNGKTVIDLGKERKLSEYQVVVLRAASKKGSSMVGVKDVILRELQSLQNIKVLNLTSFSKFPLLGKMEQGVMMANSDLPTVDYVTFGSKKGWRSFRREPAFGFPLMIKGRFGSHGRTVRLCENWSEFEEVFSTYKEGSVLVQPKLKVRQWYRVIVVGGKYLGEMRHRQKDKYGGEEGTLVKLSEEKMLRLREISLRVAKLFECDYAGIDIAYDEDRKDFVILEVNRTAQFKYFEKRSGVDVAGEIIKTLL